MVQGNISAHNKGEWSELYAFIKILREGRIYAADENVNRIETVYLPIIKIIREEIQGQVMDYHTGDVVRIYKDNLLLGEVTIDELQQQAKLLFERIVEGPQNFKRTIVFSIEEIVPFMDKMFLTKVTARSSDKIDMKMQIHDIQTGYRRDVGFSIKSDVGSPPTLLNPGKNTRFQYKIYGLTAQEIDEINSIDTSVEREYMVKRISRLFELADKVEFFKVKDPTFNDNLIMIDSLMPQLYGEMILKHYREIASGLYDCSELISYLKSANPINYNNSQVYEHKFKKLLVASALGMTPGKIWDGLHRANGGYIIIKRDGDILCYHLYNRDFFEDYLLRNTRFDRPSASRYDYAYIYYADSSVFIDLNVQIRFKSIPIN